MNIFNKYPFQQQHDQMDCAPSCLKMLSKFYGRDYSLDYLREISYLGRDGVSLLSINDAATSLGFRSLMVKISFDKLLKDCPLPCILHWEQEHFVVLYKVTNPGKKNPEFIIGDPSHGIVKINKNSFLSSWISTEDDKGTALLLDPTSEFYKRQFVNEKQKRGYKFLFSYLLPYKKQIIQLVIGMLIASAISLIFPFLTQILIDVGVNSKNLSLVYLILLSQLFLFIGETIIEIIRSWLLLHINSRISLNIISDFLIKLLKLPIKYFDTKSVGDLSQRINDHHRVESFLTGSTLTSLFSIINISIFTIVLAIYNFWVFFIFLFLSALGITWVLLFQKKRKQLDYIRFSQNRENQNKLFEMITGMQEIKLFGSETNKRWEWERLQVKYCKLNIKSLRLEQYQSTGFGFLTHLKNIIISFISATEVVKGNLSIGAMLSISYIIGQTNSPIDQLVRFIKTAQDARLSLERLQEINIKDEEEKNKRVIEDSILEGNINIKNLSFQYEGPNSPFVIKNLNMTIPKGKVTAIVGTSGSGKTTLMKLLLKFYQPTEGLIALENEDISLISPKQWRSKCGTVMQDGFIFNDTITKNIAFDGKPLNITSLEDAIKIANLHEFVDKLPLGYTTKIGAAGIGLSGGQKQRILIARAVYKNPNYLFFDEATSALDANNEKLIMNNLKDFFTNKTVVIIAHRLSTVKNADQIIVLEKGQVIEQGTHQQLTVKKGTYFELVKNQLELGE